MLSVRLFLRGLGAAVEDVSVPMHLDGPAIWTAIAIEGLQAQMMNGNGMGFNWRGMYTTSLLDAHAAWRARANELSPSLKVCMMAGEYFMRDYRGHFYAKAQNLSRVLAKAVAGGVELVAGELHCDGWRNRAVIGSEKCHNLLRYKLTLRF